MLVDPASTINLPAVIILDSTNRRDHAETLRRVGFLADAEYMKPWAEKIRPFVFNFGGIEFVTHKYLLLL